MSKMKTINIALIGYGFVGKPSMPAHPVCGRGLRWRWLPPVMRRKLSAICRTCRWCYPEEAITHPDIDPVGDRLP